ncbi:zona pellucida sperm-binding protein 3 receptor-like isoform X1 [Macaca nemestrina]|uniref:zona pellucida sperm-binding protein 3 receptor-like isoform X1 n=1 Tax=Macaca nemestrina TaxID=9545 RepID=UPI0005F4511C|nr:zona pellucida sperm-binding protein 3 receptor-like isoform X1 [Macaca nemestrina]
MSTSSSLLPPWKLWVQGSSPKTLKRHQIMHSQKAPLALLEGSTFDRKGEMAALLFSRLWKVSNSTLFQMMLVTVLLATVLGDCGPPPKLPFASPINPLYDTEFKTGTTLKYTCHPGYGKINSSRLICDTKGSWNYSIFCAKKRCRNPELINGIVEVKKDLLLGSTIEFSCSEGFFLIGSTTSRCQIQGKGVDWSDPLPECVIAKCEPPPDIRNGKHSGGDREFYTYASSVTYTCNPYFSLIGNASISCMVENKTIGVWSPNPPICEKIVCRRPQIPKAIFVSGFGPLYTYKDSIVVNCEEGYSLRGSSLIYCEANNEWYPSVPSCVSMDACTDLPDISYASWERNDYNLSDHEIFEIGTELKYLCKPGYRPVLDEPLTVTCQENLTWTSSNECERVCCPTPDLENIRIINERRYFTGRCVYAYGDNISYMCDEGYYPVSVDGESSCHTDGTWKPKMPACEPVCSYPPSIAHGHYKEVILITPYPEATYECDEGYVLAGFATIYCKSFHWQHAPPQCKALCLKPEIVNGRLSVDKDQYVEPENVTIECDSGYGVIGPKSITCSETRTWYPEVPRCEWEAPEGCEQVLTGRKLMQCLPSPEDVKVALEVYKLSLEIKQLEKERDKLMNTHQKFSEKEEMKDLFFPSNQHTESSFINSTLP